jgi:hypothetical protein
VIFHSVSVDMATLVVTFSGRAVVVTVTGATPSTLAGAVSNAGDVFCDDLPFILKDPQFWSTSTGKMKRKGEKFRERLESYLFLLPCLACNINIQPHQVLVFSMRKLRWAVQPNIGIQLSHFNCGCSPNRVTTNKRAPGCLLRTSCASPQSTHMPSRMALFRCLSPSANQLKSSMVSRASIFEAVVALQL